MGEKTLKEIIRDELETPYKTITQSNDKFRYFLKLASVMVINFLILAGLGGSAGGELASPIVINFEDLPEGVNVFQQYADKGITFNDPRVIDYSKMSPSLYQGFAHSGTKVIESCYPGDEFCKRPFKMSFTAGQKRIKVWVGYSVYLFDQTTVVLHAFDKAGIQVNQTTVTLQPSNTPIPIQTSMEVKSDSANIYSVTVDVSSATGITQNLAVDDVEFDTPASTPCKSTQNPIVQLIQPTPGQEIAQSNSFDLEGTVTTTAPLISTTLIVTGQSGSKSMDLLSNGHIISHNGGTFRSNGISGMLSPGSNTITVKAQDCGGSGESSTTVIFHPCDSAASPVVTINKPTFSQVNNADITAEVVLDNNFELSGKIDSATPLESVTLTVIEGLLITGDIHQTHQINLNPNNNGNFDLWIKDQLFPGYNTIKVTAQNREGCSGQAIATLAFKQRGLRRISGVSYLGFTWGDKADTYYAEDGYLHVTHVPGCGIKGNEGNDFFFVKEDLPIRCKLERIEFHRFWPKKGPCPSDSVGNQIDKFMRELVSFGGGSYLTHLYQGLHYPDSSGLLHEKKSVVYVHWENSCSGEYERDSNEYVISFIVSVPEDYIQTGALHGEPLFDPNQLPIGSIQPPKGFTFNEEPCEEIKIEQPKKEPPKNEQPKKEPSKTEPSKEPPKTEPQPSHLYFFKITKPDGECFRTQMISAPDETTAKYLVEYSNQPYKAEPITEQQYMDGCSKL